MFMTIEYSYIVMMMLFGYMFAITPLPSLVVKQIGLMFTLIMHTGIIAKWLNYVPSSAPNIDPLTFVYRYLWFDPLQISFASFNDALSLNLALLVTFLFPLVLIYTWESQMNEKNFVIIMLILEFMLLGAFTTSDLFLFYIFFESTLIPMFLIIGLWGSRERRILANYYFFLYTFTGSLFLLIGICYLYIVFGSTNFILILYNSYAFNEQLFLWFLFFFAFAVKIPLFPFHLWLPEAHVEAPTAGSVVLAGILLKLGGYGFLRFFIPMFPYANEFYQPVLFTCAALGVLYSSLSAIRQIDLKKIIAHASIAHMNLVVLGIFSSTTEGTEGALCLLLGHGITSSALFFCVGMLYERTHSRLITTYGGLSQTMPIFSTFFFIFLLTNMGLPGTCNFIGEFLIFLGLAQTNLFLFILLTTSVLWSSIYSINIATRTLFGTLNLEYSRNFFDLNFREFSVLLPLLIVNVFLGIHSSFLSNTYVIF